MTGGRWDPQTRIAVVVIGVLVVTIGVLTTLQWHSGVGAAALVIGGLVVLLAGVAGGTALGPRETTEIRVFPTPPALPAAPEPATNATSDPTPAAPPVIEALPTPVSRPLPPTPAPGASDACESGDLERATASLTEHLRALAPQAAAYHDAVRAIVVSAAGGRAVRSTAGQVLGPLTLAGLPIAVDVRAGSGFSPDHMRETYRALFEAVPAVEAILVVVNTADVATLEPVAHLREVLGRPVVVVPWRIGDPTGPVVNGLAEARHQSAGPSRNPAPPPAPPVVPVPRTEPDAAALVAPVPQPRRVSQRPVPPQPDNDSAAWQRASDLHFKGQLQDAERAYQAIVRTRTQSLGPEHPATLTARDQHATVLRDLDRVPEALAECEAVLRSRVAQLGEDHVDTLTSRSHLASILHQAGEFTRAEAEHGRVLQTRIRVLGSGHQQTLITRSNLAKVYQDSGHLSRAIAEHETVLKARAALLGTEHRDTLMSQSLLASALHLAGQLDAAERQHRAVLQSRMRLLGADHLDTAVSRHRLATVLHDLGRLADAVAEYRSAREAYTALLGAESPFVRAVASDLALAERALRAAG